MRKTKIERKHIYLILCSLGLAVCIAALILVALFNFQIRDVVLGITTCAAGALIPLEAKLIQDCMDKTSWEESLRSLRRSKQLDDDTEIRNSYAYAFKIIIDGKYLLTMNSHGLNKYQPPCRTYHLSSHEKETLIDELEVREDDKQTINRIKDDYRLFVKVKYQKQFFERFDKLHDDSSSEYNDGFKQFLTERNINAEKFGEFKITKYKRVVTKVRWSPYYQCYELLVCDVLNVHLNEEQKSEILKAVLNKNCDDTLRTEKDIRKLGVNEEEGRTSSDLMEISPYLVDRIEKECNVSEIW